MVPCLATLGMPSLCAGTGTEAFPIYEHVGESRVTSKVFDCAARLGDRCLGAGPAGAAVVKFSGDAASTATNVLDARRRGRRVPRS